MSQRLFKVDLSDGARDFQPTATEPGLAMLDRNNANYTILRRWLGDFIAEPEWKGQDVHFHVRDEAHGRLEDVHCVPCTKAELLGPALKESLDEIDQKLRKARPETANEQLLHRIVRKKFADLTRDYDASDFHCYFFKYRQKSEPWRLVWCWGYQRTDVEPANTLVCINKDCEALYEKRPRQRARCPVCATVGSRGRKPPMPLWLRVSSLALLLLFLLCGILFFAMNRPQLVATPDDWGGPPGSRVKYKVQYKRWFFFNDEVTDLVVPQSHDKRIVRFEPYGALAKARSQGRTLVTFRYKNLSVDSTVRVGPPKQPKSIALEPAGDVNLVVGSTKQMKLIGTYDAKEKLDPVDLTEMAEWKVEDAAIAFGSQGKLEGATEGLTKVTARYHAGEKDPWLSKTADVVVKKADYKSIELAVVPQTFGLGSGGEIRVFGVDGEGKKHSLLGSSLLKLSIEPAGAAKLDGDYLVGTKKGKAKLNASLHKLTQSAEFEVGDPLIDVGTFAVYPSGDVTIYVGEVMSLDVTSGSEAKIDTKSSKPTVVDVQHGDGFRQISLVGRTPGVASVTLKQGSETATINVTVKASGIVSLHIDPPVVILASGQAQEIRVYGLNADGDQIDVAPDRLQWVKQPPGEHAQLNRNTLEMFGVTPSETEWPLVAQLGTNEKMRAHSAVQVVSNPTVSMFEIGGDEFLVHPPVTIVGGRIVPLNAGTYLGNELGYSDGHVVVGDIGIDSIFGTSGVPRGTVITRIGDRDLTGMSVEEIRRYLAANPIVRGERLTLRMADGTVRPIKLGETGILVQEVRLVSFSPENLTPDDFNAALTLELREAAEYRVTSATGEALNDWQQLGPNAVVSLTTSKITRTGGDEYELFIERKIGDNIRRYQLPFKLTTMTP